MNIGSIITSPVLTEKATQLAGAKVYTFRVNQNVTKHQVKTALESLYKVKISNIRVTVRKGKTRKVGKRMIRKQLPDRKIAYVYVKEGSIDIFPKA